VHPDAARGPEQCRRATTVDSRAKLYSPPHLSSPYPAPRRALRWHSVVLASSRRHERRGDRYDPSPGQSRQVDCPTPALFFSLPRAPTTPRGLCSCGSSLVHGERDLDVDFIIEVGDRSLCLTPPHVPFPHSIIMTSSLLSATKEYNVYLLRSLLSPPSSSATSPSLDIPT
jgi:hypothetical protein